MGTILVVDGLQVVCLGCGVSQTMPSKRGLDLAAKAGGCQGCRAEKTFRQNPALVLPTMDMWSRNSSWPVSKAWMRSVPDSLLQLYGLQRSGEGATDDA